MHEKNSAIQRNQIQKSEDGTTTPSDKEEENVVSAKEEGKEAAGEAAGESAGEAAKEDKDGEIGLGDLIAFLEPVSEPDFPLIKEDGIQHLSANQFQEHVVRT